MRICRWKGQLEKGSRDLRNGCLAHNQQTGPFFPMGLSDKGLKARVLHQFSSYPQTQTHLMLGNETPRSQTPCPMVQTLLGSMVRLGPITCDSRKVGTMAWESLHKSLQHPLIGILSIDKHCITIIKRIIVICT